MYNTFEINLFLEMERRKEKGRVRCSKPYEDNSSKYPVITQDSGPISFIIKVSTFFTKIKLGNGKCPGDRNYGL